MAKSKRLIKAEEIFNSISHGLGVLLAIAGTVLLIIFSALSDNVWAVVSCSVFGSTMIALYLASTLFHSAKKMRRKARLNHIDHSMIYLLIAGSYTPLTLVILRGALGWTLFGIIWALAIVGVVYKLFFYKGRRLERKLSAILYVCMGWLVIIAIVPLIRVANSATLWFLLAGGLSYSGGVVFYVIKKIPFGHGLFHLTILGGSICHFFAFLSTILS